MISDELQRQQALNPENSFIVQAPAGSGKTELLTQRFLVLLGIVKQPEEILAITFTKKSAAEMRARIIHALQNALTHPEPETAHQKKTWRLAKKVLAQDTLLQWNLLASPSRLRLQTIDSFNSSLTRQLPILSHFGATPDITDDALPLYRQAVQDLLSHLEEDHPWSEAIATILLHMDNDLNKVELLLINLLSKRDQWLRHIDPHTDTLALRQHLENQLASVVTDILINLAQHFPKKYQAELLYLIRYAAANVHYANPESAIADCLDLLVLPDISADNKKYWLGIRELLFTKSDEWRKKCEKDIGFPAPTHFKNPAEKAFAADMKKRAMELITALSQHEELKYFFKELKYAPDTTYHPIQWETLAALHQVLHVAAASLKVTFQQYGKIDYIENALAALHSLGTEELPTDLTLALDYQIKHILIDEFQDTSNSQYQLLKKMTAGWEPNDGRTLFLVGDPMQSIYRFREAEVGIFIRARTQGIGQVKLKPLALTVNFRSTSGIVNWVNRHFPSVLASLDDIATGAVSYSPSDANQVTDDTTSAVTLNAFLEADSNEQANAIVALIQQRKKANPKETIAILVRSRTHLEEIIPALNAANLAYRAIDIDPLTERPFIQDLIALTRALLHPADRIAWLAVLRAPWCGLLLSDLLLLSGDDSKISLWERLQTSEIISSLSPDGQARIKRIVPVLNGKLFERRRFTLRTWIESTWLLLGGPACVDHETDLENALAYFKLLEKLDQGGDLVNLDMLDSYVSKLYAAPNHHADDTLQIMTIHNAKGLEFDTVILPHLQRKASNDDKQLLLWMERQRADESSALILAPVHAVGNETDSIYEYIKKQNAIKNDYERGRLLYVAATRAKKHLDLFFNLKNETKTNANSLLEKLWLSIKNEMVLKNENSASYSLELTENPIRQPHFMRRLAVDWQNLIKEDRLAETLTYHQKKAGFELPNENPRLMGTLIHQVLQQICQWGETWWTSHTRENKSAYLKNHLRQLGVFETDLYPIISTINLAIENTLTDARGRWILSAHKEAQAEFRLTAVMDTEIQQFIIDRTFVDENDIRWVIDYKTSTPAQENLADFFKSEQQKYHSKMWHYFQAIREIDQRPIRMGLYFPLLPAWHEIVL
jgi:ATP-dependent helicase/nuclease subunit A